MGVYGQYNILPYIKERQKFKTLNGVNIFTSSDADIVIENMKKNAQSFLRKDTAKKLQTALNNTINSQSENYEKLVNKIIKDLGNSNFDFLSNIGLLQQTRGSITLKRTKSIVTQYETELRNIAAQISTKYTDEDDLNKVMARINGSLNKLRGDIFENLLADLLDTSKGIVSDLASASVDQLTDLMIQNMERYSKGNVKAVNKTNLSSSKVMGAELKDSLQISIDNQKITVSGSQGKTDVAVNGLAGDFTGISAKNYRGGSRQISLLGGANIAGLIIQWPGLEMEKKNLALNGLSAISISNNQFNIMKQIFTIQGLMGLENEDIKSQLFIINTNKAKNPILVFSVYDLLFEQNLEGDFTGTILNPIADLPRDVEEFISFINNTKISIHTQLKISQLQNLTS